VAARTLVPWKVSHLDVVVAVRDGYLRLIAVTGVERWDGPPSRSWGQRGEPPRGPSRLGLLTPAAAGREAGGFPRRSRRRLAV
jgi:hypothetical protein